MNLRLLWTTLALLPFFVSSLQGVDDATLYFPVPLDGYANHQADAQLLGSPRVAGEIPFVPMKKTGADNFFLKEAHWPDWKSDPSDYYAAYDSGPRTTNDPARPVFKIPVADYEAVYLLAAADNDRSLTNVLSFRIGVMAGHRRLELHDFSVAIPRFDEAGKGRHTVFSTPAGNVFLVRVPLHLAIAQDFKDEKSLDVELTKELKLAVRAPDPCRFNYRPLGIPSGVHVFAMTFARSPVQMEVTSDEAGHIFNEPLRPTFRVRLRGTSPEAGRLSLRAEATDYHGRKSVMETKSFTLPVHGEATHDLAVPVEFRGYHELRIRLLRGKTELLTRDTTFALLPPDTRRHRDESPFGTWDFGGAHFTPDKAEHVGPLYVKAGLRYGMFPFSGEERKRYGVLNGLEPRNADLLAKILEKDPLSPKTILIFHEDAISGAHIMRTPDVFTGRAPYKLDATEQAKFDSMWKEAVQTAKTARKKFPDAKISFGNGNPHLMEEFTRHKFPFELFDSRGNEAGSFMRLPETQPLDFIANNASLWMDRQILDHYGYKEKPITQCYEICYPSTNPGNLPLATQASYFVRHAMHSLAWGMPIIRSGIITDVGNSYYFSNWGASGLCFAKPEVSPKPAYVAFATMTQELDGAKFSRIIETPSLSLYALEFRKTGDGFVNVIWTIKGSQNLEATAGNATLTDLMGNATTIRQRGGKVRFQVSGDPVFIKTEDPISAIKIVGITLDERPKTKSHLISTMAQLKEWTVQAQRDTELEWFNFESPRRWGDFSYSTVSKFMGEKSPLQVKPRLPVEGSVHLPMYSGLVLNQPAMLPGRPTELGIMVHGNSGWGRLNFELEDAGGQRWNSIGAAQTGEATRWMADWMSEKELAAMKKSNINDWNTNDSWGRSRIHFDGWSYLRFPLPGNYDGEKYHWPGNSNWKHDGDGVVRYPLKFTRLVIELPEKVLHFNRQVSAPRPDIYLKDLQVTYEPLDKVFGPAHASQRN